MFNKTIHKFKIELTASNENTILNLSELQTIQEINIQYNYMTAYMPVIILNLKVTKYQLDMLRDEKLNLFLRIYRRTQSMEDNQNEDNDNTIYDKIIFEDNLKAFDNPVVTQYSKEDEENENGDKIEVEQKFDYQLSTLPMAAVEYNYPIINTVYEKCTGTEALISLLSEFYDNELYMEEPTNIIRYNNIIVPPMNPLPALEYIQEYYNIYEDGMNLFFDMKKLYIYDMFSLNKPYENTFTINVKPLNESNGTVEYTIPFTDNNNVKINLSNEPSYGISKDFSNDSIGDVAIYSSYDDDYNLITRRYNTTNSEKKKIRYYWNTSRINYSEESNNSNLNKITTINILNCDPSLFNPSTLCQINSTLDYMSGSYAICSKEVKFYLHNSEFVSAVSLVLGKIENKKN